MGTYCHQCFTGTIINELTGQVFVAAKNIQTGTIGGPAHFLADPRLAPFALFFKELILIHETGLPIDCLTRRLFSRV
jgi:hypothetical protein